MSGQTQILETFAVLSFACGLGAVLTVFAYIWTLVARRQMRPLPSIALFCSGMALGELGVALVKHLQAEVHLNVVYAAAFLLLAAIAQIAANFRFRAPRSPETSRVGSAAAPG